MNVSEVDKIWIWKKSYLQSVQFLLSLSIQYKGQSHESLRLGWLLQHKNTYDSNHLLVPKISIVWWNVHFWLSQLANIARTCHCTKPEMMMMMMMMMMMNAFISFNQIIITTYNRSCFIFRLNIGLWEIAGFPFYLLLWHDRFLAVNSFCNRPSHLSGLYTNYWLITILMEAKWATR